MTDAELFEAFDTYQVGRGLSELTRKRRRHSLANFARFMTPRPIATAAAGDVDEWLARLQSPATKRAYYSDLVAFFRWAHRRELVATDPMLRTDAPKVPKRLPKPTTTTVIETALMLADGPTQLMLLLGSLAGLRAAEIAALAMDDVYLDHKPPVLVVRNGKGGKDRIVPLHPTLAGRLATLPPGPLFPVNSATCEHLSSKKVGAQIATVLTRAADGRRVTGHQLRHYFGTEAAKWAKGNVILVAGLMGHASTDTTMGYIGWQPEEGADVVSRIGTGQRPDVPDELAQRRAVAATR